MPLPGEKNIQVISKLFALKSHLETNSTFPTLFPHLTVQSFPRAQTKANTISIKRLAEVSRSRKLLKSQSKLNKKKTVRSLLFSFSRFTAPKTSTTSNCNLSKPGLDTLRHFSIPGLALFLRGKFFQPFQLPPHASTSQQTESQFPLFFASNTNFPPLALC